MFLIDILVIVAYLIYLGLIGNFIEKEADLFDRFTFTITDFTLRITKLPEAVKWQNPHTLRALLTNHFVEVCNKEDQ